MCKSTPFIDVRDVWRRCHHVDVLAVDVAPPSPRCIELHQQWYLYVPVSRIPHTSLRSPNIYRQVIMIVAVSE